MAQATIATSDPGALDALTEVLAALDGVAEQHGWSNLEEAALNDDDSQIELHIVWRKEVEKAEPIEDPAPWPEEPPFDYGSSDIED